MVSPMGRRRSKDFDLPPLVTRKRGRYYYGRNQLALGSDFAEMLRNYAEVHAGASAGPSTFTEAVRQYIKAELPKKAVTTRKGYERQLGILVKVFGHMELAAIEPQHVAKYLAERGNSVSATREKALLSAVFNFARGLGLTPAPNPCAGIRGKKAKRTRYVTDAELRAVLAAADPTLRDFLELCYYTGQDSGRVCKMTRADVREGALWAQRTKTGEKVRIDIVGPLQRVLARLTQHTVGSVYLIRDKRGQPMTLQALRRRFENIRSALGADWQIRDLRAKAATDLGDNIKANKLLAHSAMTTTDRYVGRHAGRHAEPVMREIADTPPAFADNAKK